jgi:hypothetical protein
MAVKFTNNAATTLAAGINSSVTSISVTDGSVFPALTGSDHFYVTFDDTTNREIVKVTARSGNTLTVVRGQDNTTAQAFNSGDRAELRVVAALLEDITTEVTSTLSVDTFTGDGTTTAFTLSQAPSSEDNLIVFIEGAYQNPGDFVLSGTTLTLDEAPVDERNIIVYHVKGAVSGNNLNQDSFTADGNTAAFTLSIAPIHENNTQVFIDGVYQQKNSYSVSGTTLTLDANPSNGATVEVMTFTQTDVNTLPASFVSGLTEVTAVGADHFMIFDATDSALKKSLVSDVLESATSISTSADATAITIDSSENVTFTNNVTINSGQLTAGGLAYPTSDGTNGQVLTTDGAGTLSFADGGVAGIVSSADATAITIDSNENVGIGTTSPDMQLEVAGASGSASSFKLSGRPDWTSGSGQYNVGNIYGENLGAGVNTTRIKLDGDDTSGTIQFYTASGGTLTSAMYIDSNQNITMSGTGAVKVPSGTTAQRPSSPTAGMVRYNTTLGEYESYVVNDWKILSSRDFTYSIDYLAVAGGGGGGSCSSANGSAGGGGAGGLLESSVTVSAGVTYTITVGSGGAGGSAPSAQRGANGVDSSISGSGINTITAIGGGGGGGSSSSGQQNGSDGGSGGGGGFQSSSGGSGTTGQGNAGGFQNSGSSPYGGAGGGGAGAAGANGHGTDGGAGSSSSITGASATYAGGGGGGNELAAAGAGGAGGGGAGGQNGAGTAGTANTGGGGGGGGGVSASNGGNGGSGVVILSIPTADYSGTTTGSPTITTSGSNTIIKFTQSGSYTA